MSDFDKYFADRLDEESQFPRRDANWKSLSKRLDAFDTGLQGRPTRLRYWQAAAAISIIAVSVLFGKVYQMQKENSGLRERIAGMEQHLQQTSKPDTNSTQPAGIELPNPFVSDQNSAAPQIQYGQSVTRKENGTPGPTVRPNFTPITNNAEKTAANGKRISSPVPEISDKTAGSGMHTPAPKPDVPVAVRDRQTPGSKEADNHTGTPETLKPGLPAAEDRAFGSFTALPVQLAPIEDKRVPQIPATAIIVSAPIIKPVRHQYTKYRIGVEATAGLPVPSQKGVSALVGAGITAAYTPISNLRINASMDWLRHEVCADSAVHRFHIPNEPHMKPPGDLAQVEGSQRSQNLSLGLAYVLPVRFPVHPAVRVAHTWRHWTAANYSFRFEKQFPPVMPPYKPKFDEHFEVEKSKPEWDANNWSLGLGLEAESSRLAFGVWVDYSKNLTTHEPAFDAFYVRAGVSYKFD